MKLVTVAEMRSIEREADAAGLTYAQMMENAGSNLADYVAERYASLKEEGVIGLVGSGNNGGDTLVALARLAELGWMANAYLVRPRPEVDPLVERLRSAGGSVYSVEEDPDKTRLAALLTSHGILLDGVLGTGVQLPLKEEVARILGKIQKGLASQTEPPVVVAVDCPSGVDCDSGEAAPETIPADLTITMAAMKAGLLKFPAFKLVGELQVVGIGLPEEGVGLESWNAVRCVVPSPDRIRQILPQRPPDSHKGTFGTALIVAGSVNYTGAALLAGKAAYRVGAGLVTLAVPAPLHSALAGQFPEATWVILPHDTGVISPAAVEVLRKNLERPTALLVGPGFGMEDPTAKFISRLFGGASLAERSRIGFVHAQPGDEPLAPGASRASGKSGKPNKDDSSPTLPPLVIDADGLKLLARLPDWHTHLPAPAVLTPHPGEMAVLTGLQTSEIQANRLETAQRFSQQWGHVVVLKGAFTIIAAPDGQAAVIPVATAALARAGTGDVLAGLITGLRAQGVDAFPAAIAGAWIHAQAGLKAAEILGNTASVLAGDVLDSVIDVLSELAQD